MAGSTERRKAKGTVRPGLPADMLYPPPPDYVLLDARKDRPLQRATWRIASRGSTFSPVADSKNLTQGSFSWLISARTSLTRFEPCWRELV
jgi:hypothetical protein